MYEERRREGKERAERERAEMYRRAEVVENEIGMKDRVLAPDWWVRCQDKMSRWLEDRREEEQEAWYECNEGCDEGMDGVRMNAEMMMMMNEMSRIEGRLG